MNTAAMEMADMGAADMEMPDTNAGADTGMDITAADIKRAALRSAPVGAKRVPLARSAVQNSVRGGSFLYLKRNAIVQSTNAEPGAVKNKKQFFTAPYLRKENGENAA